MKVVPFQHTRDKMRKGDFSKVRWQMPPLGPLPSRRAPYAFDQERPAEAALQQK
jgi:hypothetical protein